MATMNKAAFSIQLQGHPPANRDARVKLVNQATGQTIERQPFLDGSLLVRDLDPGNWEVEVTHPNLIQPIDKRIVRLFPQPAPTRVPVIVPPGLFRDTPIRDIPDANLGPVQQAATAAREEVRPLATKAPGEVIRASDWNQLAGAVVELANAVLELTHLVTPVGHDHPEIADKIDEVQGNIRRFAESFGRSLLELRRDIESQQLRRTVGDVLDLAAVAGNNRERLLGRVADLELSLQAPTPVFTGKLAATGNVMLAEVQQMAAAQGDAADTFLAQPAVQQLQQFALRYVEAGTQVEAESELGTYMRTSIDTAGSKFSWARR